MKNQPLTLTIFGATGDLYQNKLSVSLFDLFSEGLLPTDFIIIGFARRSFTDDDFRTFTYNAILNKKKDVNIEKLHIFLSHIIYLVGNLDTLEDFVSLGKHLSLLDEQKGVCTNKLFYLSVPPSLYEVIFKNISRAGLTGSCVPTETNTNEATPWTRVLVEKPFGQNIEEAEHLDMLLGELFDESQVFRIDHYLAKETVQNLLTFRFSNGVFESLWNNKDIEKVRIIVHETNVVGARGAFYDGIGALRDVGQNHMLQMLAHIAMENPGGMNHELIRKARAEVIEKVFLLEGDASTAVIRGQYDGYLQEAQVKPESTTETFFRIALGINNKRWNGVLFELESGKALKEESVKVEVYFKETTSCLCPVAHTDGHQNILTFTIQPNDGISFKFWFKRPGFDFELEPQNLSFKYSESALPGQIHDAYERVLYDCINGDQTLFTNTKEIMAEWNLITKIIKSWQSSPLTMYSKGSAGEDIK
jgi:glucose-6-phosphate 1-dehydrogenase